MKVVVVTRGREVALKLYRTDPDRLFAVCPIRNTPGAPAGIEPVTDSSRYFCLRIEDGKGNHAFIGLGFNKREDAFDLKTSIADAQKHLDAEEKGGVDLGIGDLGTDFSLKQGQKIAISIGGGGGAGAAKHGSGAGAGAAAGAGGGKLAPPGSVKLRAPGAAAAADPFGGPASPAPAPAPAPAAGSDWVAF